MRKIILLSSAILVFLGLNAQPDSHRQLTRDDAFFTTYAADIDRTVYRWDQAYHFMFYKDNKPISFVSDQGGSLGMAFIKDGALRMNLEEMYSPPIISVSFNDLVKFSFFPFKDIKVESTFLVYSSTISLQEVKITNRGLSTQKFEVLAYFLMDVDLQELTLARSQQFEFKINKLRDSWMKEHDIPLVEELHNIFKVDDLSSNPFSFDDIQEFKSNFQDAQIQSLKNKSLIGHSLKLIISPSESKTFKIIRGIAPREILHELKAKITSINNIDPAQILINRQQDYKQIPDLTFASKDYKNLYWSAFNLMRQCMMPPEGESSFNYYVFSREPKWGWGFGGQVFHESLVMLAYAYMDPTSAMNSQRVFMERQWPSGYINYRTGPYLNEQIEYEGQFTSSAPWFNYQNYQVYKISGDKSFLAEAYKSGVAFYNYYVANRDTNNNGLSEWGAHAVLESVRDARVAVWDRVDWPSNFESPDLNAMLVMEAKSLAKMATELGLAEEAGQWQEKAETRTVLINKYLWDEESGFYYNADKKDLDFSYNNANDLKIMEIIGFIPLWAGVASDQQAAKLVEHLTDPNKFWRRFGVPTLSAEDEYYNPIGYWNGPIWIPWQYLLFRGLIDYGYEDIALQLAEKVLDNVIYHLKKDHTFWEFYSADDYQAGWNKTYIWTGMVARFLIDMQQLEVAQSNR